MMGANIDIWVLVVLCVLAGQAVKTALYSVPRRRLHLAVLGQSAGLPSAHAAASGCLATLCAVRSGWQAPETSAALVFTVIAVFDAVRVRSAAQEQRRLLHELAELAPDPEPWRVRVAGYLDVMAHAPGHVVAGLVWGFLFALAFGWV
jgi:acid phosphatase family membrane protein YuiD